MKLLLRLPLGALALLSSVITVSAHGGHDQQPIADDADWATRHMAEEHHITSFDAGVLFTLHDYDNTGLWGPDDIKRTYGLFDTSTRHVSPHIREELVHTVLQIFDTDRSGRITKDEFEKAWALGARLPDFGIGPGHHGDDEYEYEIHHWEKYHGDDAKEEDLVHPEDIEHFRKHDEDDRRREEWEAKEAKGVVVENIPGKFRIN